MKRILSVLIAAAVALSAAGCKNSEDNKTSDNDKTLSYWCGFSTVATQKYQSMAELPMYKEREKQSGIHIKFVHPPAGQETEQFNLMVASKDLTDIIEYDWGNRMDMVSNKENGVIIPLNDLMKKHTPNLNKYLNDKNYDYGKQSKTDDGIYYGFPMLNSGKYRVFCGPILRSDWLEDLGLEVPETIDEWETVLRAFKEKKGAQAPFTGDASLFWTMPAYNNNFNSAFNVYRGLYVENGKVKYGPKEAGFKEWIELMSRWYKEGLLDNDFATNSTNIIDAQMTDGTSGARIGFIGSTMGVYMNMMKDKDKRYSLVAAPYPVKNKGDVQTVSNLNYDAQQPYAAITTECKNPEMAAEWLDYWYSDEGILLTCFGIEGDTYTMKDGHPVYTDKILKNPDGLSIADAMSMNFRGNGSAIGVLQQSDYLKQYYPYKQQQDAIELWNNDLDAAKQAVIPPVTVPAEYNDEVATLSTEITTYVQENIMKMVQGSIDINQYDSFLKKLDKLNVDRYIEIYQQAYDKYKER